MEAVEKVIIDNPDYQVIESEHTKKNKSLFVLQLKNRVEDKFKLVSKRVEKRGGYYSGHQKGFVFNRILSQEELNEIFKGIFFEEKIAPEQIEEGKDAWNYTIDELKQLPYSTREDGTFVFKYNMDGKPTTYSVRVPSNSVEDAVKMFAKQIIGNAILSGKYNKAVESGSMTAVRAAQIMQGLGLSLSHVIDDYGDINSDIQAVWGVNKAKMNEAIDKVRYPFLYERSEMPHLSDKRYSQIVNNALEEGKYTSLIKEGFVSANKVAFIIESAGFDIPEEILSDAILERTTEIESLVGGYADGKTIFDISEKHNVPVKEIIKQFRKGLKVEKEHTKDKKRMGEIVKDHLFENPYYYDVLLEAEKTMEEVDPSKFKTHDEYMIAYEEKAKERATMPEEEKANLKARPIVDKIKQLKKQIEAGVPEEVESFLRNTILNHFVNLFNDVVSEYIFYTPVWLDLQFEYLTTEQKKEMLMYGVYNKAHYKDEFIQKFIDNVSESEMVFGTPAKKLNNIFDLLPANFQDSIPEDIDFQLDPRNKILASLLDSFVTKGKILSSTMGVFFSKDGVFASRLSLDIFLRGKRGYLSKNKLEEGVYGLSENAKNIFPIYGTKKLSMITHKAASTFFKDYMATYGNEKRNFDKGTSVFTHDEIKTLFKDLSVVYNSKAYKQYFKRNMTGVNPLETGIQKNVKFNVVEYPILYVKQKDKLFVVSMYDMMDAIKAVIKLDMDTVQFGLSEHGLYISENVSSFINLEESGIRISIKSKETEMPHGLIYFDLNKKQFNTNYFEKKVEPTPTPEEDKKEATKTDLESRLRVLQKMIEKNPENKSELESRARVLQKMIEKLGETKMSDGGDIYRSNNEKYPDFIYNVLRHRKGKRVVVFSGEGQKWADGNLEVNPQNDKDYQVEGLGFDISRIDYVVPPLEHGIDAASIHLKLKEKMENGGDIKYDDLRKKLITILISLSKEELTEFLYLIGGVESYDIDDTIDYGIENWVNGLTKEQFDNVVFEMKRPYFYSHDLNKNEIKPIQNIFSHIDDFYEKKYEEGGDIKIKRFFGMMPSDEIKKRGMFIDDLGLKIIIQSGEKGWAILYADASSEYKDVIDTPENNFNKAVEVLKSHLNVTQVN